MKLTLRSYQDDNDYFRIRAFLREVFLLNGRRARSWDVCRFDYWRWHGVENCERLQLDEVLFLWETPGGQIAAVITPEGLGDAFFHVHSGMRTPGLEAEMLAVAEERLSAPTADGRRKLNAWAHDYDTLRKDMLAGCGYIRQNWKEYQRRRPLDGPIPDAQSAHGYTIRAQRDVEEIPSRSWASWRAFHPDEPDSKYQGWEWYHNVQRCPLYRRDLDIVAVAPDGQVAGFCTVWFDDATRMGIFEPVGVMPEHQRRGLGRAMMTEGLRRLQRMGADLAFVGSYSDEAGALYSAMGFTEYESYEPWGKVW